MELGETLYSADRAEWRAWLAANYQVKTEIWLVYYRKGSGRPTIPYNDAVEEALCFGWIDGIIKGIDEERRGQRFTPRRPGSAYSQTNKERLRRLGAAGQLMPDVVPDYEAVLAETFHVPADILAALQANERAWANFQAYSGAYQRIRIAYVDTGRNRPGEFAKRLQNLIKKSEADKQFGFGIESYYD